uniref:Uncharacterized protein n=1 Tax=Panagrolaimus davidi TaxID=227884 RepID=A0A914QHZ5_9BILA
MIDCSATEPTYDLVAPIVEFMDPKVLKDVKAILKVGGTVVVNVVSFNLELGPKILKKPHDIYKEFFNTCFYLKASLNFVMVCTDKDINGNSYQGFEELVKGLPKSIQDSLAKDILHQPYFDDNIADEFDL